MKRYAALAATLALLSCGGGRLGPAGAGPSGSVVRAARRAVVAPLFRDARVMRGLVGRPYSAQRAALMRMAARLRLAARQAPDTDAPPFQYLGGEATDIALNARVAFALDSYLRAKARRLERLARYSLTLFHDRPFQPRWLSSHPQLPTAGGTVRWLSQWESSLDGCYVIVASGYSTGAFSRATRGAGIVRAIPQCHGPDRRLAIPRRDGPARIVADRERYLLLATRSGACFSVDLAKRPGMGAIAPTPGRLCR